MLTDTSEGSAGRPEGDRELTPQEWLLATAYGYAELSPDERQAISDFCVIWSLFEGTRLRCKANPRAIARFVADMDRHGLLRQQIFQEAQEYFVGRYQNGPDAAERLRGLRFVNDEHFENVVMVLKRENEAPLAVLTALLQIVYRLRNNLFHGEKWAYGLRDQKGNFDSASRLLIALMTAVPAH